MIDENNIPSIQPDFERIKKQDNKGLEYWTSREFVHRIRLWHIPKIQSYSKQSYRHSQ